MGPATAASLLIGILVCATLLALYRFTPVFVHRGRMAGEPLPGHFRSAETAGGSGSSCRCSMSFTRSWRSSPRGSAWSCRGRSAHRLSCWRRLSHPHPFSRARVLRGAFRAVLGRWPRIVLAGLCGIDHRRHGERTARATVSGAISSAAYPRINSRSSSHPRARSKLSGKRELTVLKCRILNYAELGSQMEPHEMEKLSSALPPGHRRIPRRRGAYLDSCNAEGVRVFFGLPVEDEEHAVHGCRPPSNCGSASSISSRRCKTTGTRNPRFGVALAPGP